MKKNLKKPGNRQQATGNTSLPRLRIMVTPLRPLSAAVSTALKRHLVFSSAVVGRNKT